ncbi:hypothetical protein BD779DRAFT_1467625 [Infundibulicybe gibba]|nr:hypothetical protein BD779DRAFT_1467625 [Infundibulicybe gibba]
MMVGCGTTETSHPIDPSREWEMTPYQRGLVDASFEEGLYSSAVNLLEQLRSPCSKPSISHMRQLIYISLHPTTSPPENVPSSKRTKPLSLSPTVVRASQQLLMSLATTNSPEALARALPRYPDAFNDIPAADIDTDEPDIAKEAACIKEAKSCWVLLSETFLDRQPAAAKAKGKGRRDTHESTDEREIGGPLICDDAWFLLEWLIVLFERDEDMVEAQGKPRHSLIFVQQLPPPRDGTITRWETETPLRIVFYCFRETNLKRQMLGSRLMHLLINLSTTTYLDSPRFIASVSGSLAVASPNEIKNFISYLASIPYSFKLSLYLKTLANLSPNEAATGSGHQRERARAQPKIRRGPKIDQNLDKSTSNALISSALKQPPPPATEVFRLITMNTSNSTIPITSPHLCFRIKFELLVSYTKLQQQIPPDEADPQWSASVHGGKIKHYLEIGFPGPDGRPFRESLEVIMGLP